MLKGKKQHEKFPLATEILHLKAVTPENSITKTHGSESEVIT